MIALFRLLSGIGPGLALLARAFRWLVERPVRLFILLLVLNLLWLSVSLQQARELAQHRQAQAAAWHGKFLGQKAEMQKFVGLVAAARIEAARRDRANAARVAGEWQGHLAEVTYDYRTDLAAARAALAARLRGAGAGADGGAGGGAGAAVPGLPTLSSGAVRPGGAAIVDAADLDACTVNSLRLTHLIDAWKRAASIDIDGQP